MHRATTGFPKNGSVITFRSADDIVMQFNIAYQGAASAFSFRNSNNGNVWATWI